MKMVASIRAVTVTMVGILSLGAAPIDKPPTANPHRSLQFELTDGTVITGRTDVKTIAIRITGGNILKVPMADLTELTVGLKNQTKPQSKIKAGGTTLVER
jgi:hypothetical protein